jgi:glucose-1-phosphatase
MKHYIFDIGGVLIQYDQNKLIEYLAIKHDRPVAEVEALFTYERLFRVETGKIKAGDYFNNVVTKVLNNEYDDWIQSWMDNYTLNEQGMKLLHDLKEKGNPVYILSNQAEYNAIAIERKFPFFYKMCKHNFLSFEMGLFKPDVNFYLAACREIGAEPGQCVFFDDMEANVKGADEAGMMGFRFSNENISETRRRLSIT